MAKNKDIKKIYDVRNKLNAVQYYIDIMLNRTLSMFKYENLPDTLPEIELERILQVNGYGIITKDNDGNLVALWGGYAPPLDVYYRYKKIIVNNPWANINKEFEIGKDCVLIRNDALSKGLMPIFKKYGTFLTEADITLYLSTINFRSIYNITASSDIEKESCELFLKNIEEGKQGVMMEEEISNGIKTNPFSTNTQGYITQIIELQQYLRGTFFNEVGLNSNYNMKRERLSSSETDLNEDGLRPLIDSMLEERQHAIKKVNEMYGTNIKVSFGSSWAQYNEIENELIEETQEEPIEQKEIIKEEESNNE